MNANPQGTVDQLDFSAVFEAAGHDGPKVTFYIPTEVTDTRAAMSGDILKHQITEATRLLVESGMSEGDAQAMLDPIRELTTDSSYWRRQSRGFVAFAAPGFHQAIRIPIEVREKLVVNDQFHVMPLVPVMENSGQVYILAMSKNSNRLFNATRNTIEQLPLGSIPDNIEDVIRDFPEVSLQSRATGGGNAAFFGQGGTSETDTMLTSKYIRAVGEAVAKDLGTARSQPLVLASVAEYLPIFRKECPYPAIHDAVIAGNPEHTKPEELRSAAWKLLAEKVAAGEAAEADRAGSLIANGKGSTDLAEIAQAAKEGRVDTVYLPRDETRLSSPAATDLADASITATVRNSGVVRTLGQWDTPAEAMATFRY